MIAQIARPAVRRLIIPLALLALATAACSSAAGTTQRPSANSTSATEKGAATDSVSHGDGATGNSLGGMQPNIPAVAPQAQGGASGSSGSGVAYAYPMYAGSVGVAPEHTIVAFGSGSADMKADQSDKATAEPKAIAAALAEAKRQATSVAAAMGVQLDTTYSVSISSSSSVTYPATNCVVPPAAPNASGNPQVDPATTKCVTGTPQPSGAQVFVTITVAFNFK